MESTGHSRWFERLPAELGFELWIGDPAEVKAKRVKKQKFDREDARPSKHTRCTLWPGLSRLLFCTGVEKHSLTEFAEHL
jgi:hypothetical protein